MSVHCVSEWIAVKERLFWECCSCFYTQSNVTLCKFFDCKSLTFQQRWCLKIIILLHIELLSHCFHICIYAWPKLPLLYGGPAVLKHSRQISFEAHTHSVAVTNLPFKWGIKLHVFPPRENIFPFTHTINLLCYIWHFQYETILVWSVIYIFLIW